MPRMNPGGMGAAAMVSELPSIPGQTMPQRNAETVLAFDFGSKRIGVAVGDSALGIAHPLEVIAAEDNRRRFDRIAALVEEWRPARFVVGFPAAAEEHALTAPIARFARRLQARFGLPIERVDETLSSWDASRRLSTSGTPALKQKERLDAAAACIILETWFQQREAAGGPQ
jgi:putative Holliday junction resolvase